MKILAVLCVLISISNYFAVFTATNAEKTAESTLMMTVECPLEIKIGIQNVPEGWSPFVMAGAARQSFRNVVVSKEGGNSLIGCYYDNSKDGFPPYALSRAMPANFACKADTGVERPRTVTCVPRINNKRD